MATYGEIDTDHINAINAAISDNHRVMRRKYGRTVSIADCAHASVQWRYNTALPYRVKSPDYWTRVRSFKTLEAAVAYAKEENDRLYERWAVWASNNRKGV